MLLNVDLHRETDSPTAMVSPDTSAVTGITLNTTSAHGEALINHPQDLKCLRAPSPVLN